MKKYIIGACAVVLVVGSIFYACKKDSDNNDLENNAAFKKELIALNNDIYATMGMSKPQKTMTWWGEVLNVIGVGCQIAGADICSFAAGAGAVTGVALLAGLPTAGTGYLITAGTAGTICAVGGSYKEYTSIDQGGTPQGGTSQGGSGGSTGGKTGGGNSGGGNSGGGNSGGGNSGGGNGGKNTKSMGSLHNEVLNELYQKFAWNGFDDQFLNDLVISKLKEEYACEPTEKEFNLVIKFVTSEKWVNVMQQVKEIIVEHAKNNESPIQLLLRYNEKGLITGNTYEVLESFLKVYSAITDEKALDIVVSSYVDFVKKTDWLSENEKYILLGTLSVAYESPFFWIQFIK